MDLREICRAHQHRTEDLGEALRLCDRAARDAAAASRRNHSAGGHSRTRSNDLRSGEGAKRAALYRAGFIDELGYQTALGALAKRDPNAAFTTDDAERALLGDLRESLHEVARLTAGLAGLKVETAEHRRFAADTQREIAVQMGIIQMRADEEGFDVNRLIALAETEAKLERLQRQPQRRAA